MKLESLHHDILMRVKEVIYISEKLNMENPVITLWYDDSIFPRVYEWHIWEEYIWLNREKPYVKFGTTPSYTLVNKITIRFVSGEYAITDEVSNDRR